MQLYSRKFKEMRRRRRVGISILTSRLKIICILGFSSLIVVQILSLLQFSKFPPQEDAFSSFKPRSLSTDPKIGNFGKMIINMLPEDLHFTLFLPSEKGFERDLRMNPNDSLTGEAGNDTFAVLTRVLGFSAVPRWIHSAELENGNEMSYNSISGFDLCISKNSDGVMMVNGVVAEKVDLKMGKTGNTLVHVMDGVLMDAEFEESMQPDNYEEDV